MTLFFSSKFNFLFILFITVPATSDFSIDNDPTTWPGHLEPLASKATRIPIKILDHFPSPQEFFMNYAYSGTPVVFKGGAKKSSAFHKWSDLYLKSFPDSQSTLVGVEVNKKENRDLPTLSMPLSEFIGRYKSHNEYLVTPLLDFLRRDVLVPPPLLCNQVLSNLVDCLLWISGGETKSVLHNDNVDNINCIFSGKKEFILLNYTRYKNNVIFDMIEQNAMALDVDKVDFTKYPSLANLDFHVAEVDAGDCIYLPYKWIRQVNSFDRNIAVNVLWDHTARIVPTKKNCGHPRKGTTLADVFFRGHLRGSDEDHIPHQVSDGRDPLSDLMSFLDASSIKQITSEEFVQLAFEGVPQWSHLNMTKEVHTVIENIYHLMDGNGDGVLSQEEITNFRSEGNVYQQNLAEEQTHEQIAIEKEEQLKELQNSVYSVVVEEEIKKHVQPDELDNDTKDRRATIMNLEIDKVHVNDATDHISFVNKDEL